LKNRRKIKGFLQKLLRTTEEHRLILIEFCFRKN